MFDRFTQNAKKAMEIAVDFSRQTRNSVIGSEHVLLGLTYAEGRAKELLAEVGITKEIFALVLTDKADFRCNFQVA